MVVRGAILKHVGSGECFLFRDRSAFRFAVTLLVGVAGVTIIFYFLNKGYYVYGKGKRLSLEPHWVGLGH